jgi:hypothetical protein
MEGIIEDFQGLQHMSPILALVVETLVEHIHDLVEIAWTKRIVSRATAAGSEVLLVECEGGDFSHICARRAPWVVGGSWDH